MKDLSLVIYAEKHSAGRITFVIIDTFTPKTNPSNVPNVEKDFVNLVRYKFIKFFTWTMHPIDVQLVEKALISDLI